MGARTQRARVPGSSGGLAGLRDQKRSEFLGLPVAATSEFVLAKIYFATNEDTIDEDIDGSVLEKVLKVLELFVGRQDPFIVTCEGRADVRHDDAFNLDLSRRRAETVAGYLRTGLSKLTNVQADLSSRVFVRPLGESLSSAKRLEEDRRVDVRLDPRPLSLMTARLGFEDDGSSVGEIFRHSIEVAEVNGGGKVYVWLRGELLLIKSEQEYKALRTTSRGDANVQRDATLSREDYEKEMRSRLHAFVRIEFQSNEKKGLYRVTGQIFDVSTRVPLFPAVSVEARALFSDGGTFYKSSPGGNPVDIWRNVPDGESAPPGYTVKQVERSFKGLLDKSGQLWDLLRGGKPNISSRVQELLAARAKAQVR